MNRKTLALIALGVAISTPAVAWKHIGHVWAYEDMPVVYDVADVGSYGGQDMDYLIHILGLSYDTWKAAAPCADFSAELGNVLPAIENIGYKHDRINRVTYDDPKNDLVEPGILAASLTLTGAKRQIINGESYKVADDGDIIYNDNAPFSTDAEIASNNCGGRPSIESTTLHEIGHLMGMGHPCEREDPCNDLAMRTSTMYWQAANCETPSEYFPNSDDIASLNALYGPYATFKCSNELNPEDDGTEAIGVVPFDLKCGVISSSKSEITGVTWSWGDGETSEGINGNHTYKAPGNYTINVCFEGTRDDCGNWQYCDKKSAYVDACGVPEPAFSAEATKGLSVRLLNDTNIAVYKCISDVQWDIFAGDKVEGEPIKTLRAWEPEVTFDDAGTYTAVLNIGGPAGTGAAKLTFDVKNIGRQGACDTGGTNGAGVLALTALAVLARRRRASV